MVDKMEKGNLSRLVPLNPGTHRQALRAAIRGLPIRAQMMHRDVVPEAYIMLPAWDQATT
jgi:hypothetical protein